MDFSGVYPEPIYYLFYQDEKTTIYHSRKIYHNYQNKTEILKDKVKTKYQDISIEEIERNAAILIYEEWEDSIKYLEERYY